MVTFSSTLVHCTVNYTHHKQDWIKLCSHIAELFFNDIFQLTILMFITLAKYKLCAP
jgi:hypothetical protein